MKEVDATQTEAPDFCFLCLAHCLGNKTSCGWEGWLLDGVFVASKEKFNSEVDGKPLPHVHLQVCPNCGCDLFRSDIYVRLDQTSALPRP